MYEGRSCGADAVMFSEELWSAAMIIARAKPYAKAGRKTMRNV
jgi:hypothetical protein